MSPSLSVRYISAVRTYFLFISERKREGQLFSKSTVNNFNDVNTVLPELLK
jgi:hypothetical protein